MAMKVKYYSEKYRRKVEWQKRRQIPARYSVTRAIIDILLDAIDRPSLVLNPYERIKKQYRREFGLPEPGAWRYNRAIKYLKEKGYIETKSKNNDLFFKLTQKGKIQGLLKRLKEDLKKDQKWDGKLRAMIWDIPEKSSHERDRIRYFVKKLGFFRLQKSVFISPYPIPRSAVEYLKESELLKFIRFLRIDQTDDILEIKSHFNLK